MLMVNQETTNKCIHKLSIENVLPLITDFGSFVADVDKGYHIYQNKFFPIHILPIFLQACCFFPNITLNNGTDAGFQMKKTENRF